MSKFLKLCAVLSLSAAPAMAQTWSSNAPKIGPVNQPEGVVFQAYPAAANYCPQGLQPITLGGVICCGTPNASYSNPAGHSKAAPSCPAGVKGCS
ncbi:hypothetical protein [Shimia sp. SDUM112013]|uniref:hypothetical protein n=1 Tax=Shimia sp. SDUM112013 TaxID=3136160 RepID=UPI0032ED23E8